MEDNIKKLDGKGTLGSITNFPNQCKNAWEQTDYTPRDIQIKNILVIGMGGSALGAHIVESLGVLKVPMTISHEYTIPPWVSEETLVFAISYSGTTEETLNATREALSRNAHVVGITTGNTLEKILKEKGASVCIINRNDNPCDQPRYAVGSMMMIMLKVCSSYNLLQLSENEVSGAIEELGMWQKTFDESNGIEQVYEETKDLENKMPILIHSEHLANLGRFVRNQIHETGKALAIAHEIPELNHHLMEGLAHPTDNVENIRVLFFESNLYSDKIKKRFSVTKDVLDKQHIVHRSIIIAGGSPLAQALIGMLRGMYMAFSLALVHKRDPSDILWVNYFKEQISKP
jgi:glucose/mannose-6-phosphate isomerase